MRRILVASVVVLIFVKSIITGNKAICFDIYKRMFLVYDFKCKLIPENLHYIKLKHIKEEHTNDKRKNYTLRIKRETYSKP